MADVKWIKIATHVFDNRKIKQIERMPEGDSIIVVWFKLLCLAGTSNRNGMIFLTDEIPYTEEMLITEFGMEQRSTTLKLALRTFEKFGMIQIIENVFYISSWDKYQNVQGLEKIREQTRKRVSKHRENQKLIDCNVTCNGDVTHCNETDIDIDIEIDIDKEIEKNTKEKRKKEKLAYAQTYFPNDDKLNQTFNDFIKMRKSLKNGAMTERAITMMINKLSKYENETAIAMLEQSIVNNWKDVYEPKSSLGYKNSKQTMQDFTNVGKEWLSERAGISNDFNSY